MTSLPLRHEIRELQKNHDQWNLYLLGLDEFKKLEETTDLSYYGIAGIHGRPYCPWGGVKGHNPRGWQGYCTHTYILFAPWHRLYLALFEQQLYGIIQKIASQFPQETKARYQAAVATFRIPCKLILTDYMPKLITKQIGFGLPLLKIENTSLLLLHKLQMFMLSLQSQEANRFNPQSSLQQQVSSSPSR